MRIWLSTVAISFLQTTFYKNVLETVESKCVDDFKERWINEARTMPRLRTYKILVRILNGTIRKKTYIYIKDATFGTRIHSGTFPLAIEQAPYETYHLNVYVHCVIHVWLKTKHISSSIVTVILNMHETNCYGRYLLFTLVNYLKTKLLKNSYILIANLQQTLF